ncbi:MAG: hypothetical protein JXR91_07385, partial [Deltaproteobacteria bacterium]|nr:hypothetical protein [Deltaproteobacteria bacterium]
NDTRWNAGAGIGLEFRISPERLKRKGMTKFNFGGEIGVGFIKRGTAEFKPKLSGGDEYSIKDINTASFGTFNASGVTMDMGLILSFF